MHPFHSPAWRPFPLFAALIGMTALPSLEAFQNSAPIPFSEIGAKATAESNGAGTGIEAIPTGARLHTDFQKLQGTVTPAGLTLTSTESPSGGHLSLVASELCGKSLPATGSVAINGKTVAFSRPDITEEYSVSVDGVRQDFVVARRPLGENALELALTLSGATAEPLAEGVKLTLSGSDRELAYHRLLVTDATGRTLPANLRASGSQRLVISVEDENAVYPIRIDPTFSDVDWVSMNPGIPGVDSDVSALAVDAGGNLYVGGQFSLVGPVPAHHIAKWNGSAWSTLGSGMDDGVTSLLISGTDLYAAGRFTTAGGVPANRIAKWNGSTWSALGSGTDDTIFALTSSGGNIYAGGSFTSAGGVPASAIAKWNGSAWTAVGTGADGPVYSLAAIGSEIFAGGDFTHAGGGAAARIAKWNGSIWSALGAGANGSVRALAVSSGDLFAAGDFTTAGGAPAAHIAKWNGSAWSTLGTGMPDSVTALAVSGGDLYAGGYFSTAGGAAASGIAKWDGSAWSALGAGTEGTVSAIAISGGSVFAGGYFTSIGEITATNIGKWSTGNWSALGSGIDGEILALTVSGTDLYAGGAFTTAGSVVANHITKWNGSTWSALGTGMNDIVTALTVSGGELYAGGEFTSAGGISASHIAKWNGSAWSALGSGMDRNVGALLARNGDLYAGGDFTTAGGTPAASIAKWNGSTWSTLGSGVNSSVHSLAFIGNDLYAGGWFTTAGGNPANRVAKWNGSSWSPLGSGLNHGVWSLAVSGSDLYVGGFFTEAGGIPANRVAKWNGTSWSALGIGLDSYVFSIAISGIDLYAGGDFTNAGDVPANHIAKWDGTTWSALGSGTDYSIALLATDSTNHLYACGGFIQAGTTVSPFIVRADLPPSLAGIAVHDGATSLIDGSPAPVDFGYAPVGTPVIRTFVISNPGSETLRLGSIGKDGAALADFSIDPPASSTIAPGGTTTLSVTFTPSSGSAASAVIHLTSNTSGIANPFDIVLAGNGLSATIDTDGDGLSDAAEFNLSALGFDWQVNQTALVKALFLGAETAGLYTTEQIQAMQTGTPVISRNPDTGKFKLTLDWQKSTDLTHFNDFPAPTGSTATITPQGDIDFEFPSPDNAAFFRLQLK